MAGRRAGVPLTPLAWVVVLFALAAPVALSNHPSPAALAGVVRPAAAAPATGMERPTDDDAEGSPGVLGLPPKVHLVVNRAAAGNAPLTPVLAMLSAPVDRTDAGLRVAAGRAGTSPADAPPGGSRWGRAPPRASA